MLLKRATLVFMHQASVSLVALVDDAKQTPRYPCCVIDFRYLLSVSKSALYPLGFGLSLSTR